MNTNMFRPPSYHEEAVNIKPSIELIADEYELKSNSNISVQIFYAPTKEDLENCDRFRQTLQAVGYNIPIENLHNIDEEDYNNLWDNVMNQTSNAEGLVIFYSGYYKRENTLLFSANKEEIDVCAKDIWTRFTSSKCVALKNKPKIFIFQVTKYGVGAQKDGRKRYTFDTTYETPAEADILIIYNKTDGISTKVDPTSFLAQFCENIQYYGKSEDVLSLATLTECDYFATRPLLVSTLTRKFFFTSSNSRGHYHYINEKQDEIAGALQNIHESLPALQTDTNKHEKDTKPKPKSSIFKRFSFKDKKSTDEKTRVSKSAKVSTTVVQEEVVKKPTVPQNRKQSSSGMNHTGSKLSLTGSIRKSSGTDMDHSSKSNAKKSNEKPAWKL